MKPGRFLLLVLGGLLMFPPAPADGASLLSATVSSATAVERDCFEKRLSSGAGYAVRQVDPPARGLVQARLEAAGGDWDLALFDGKTGSSVAAASGFGDTEVAEGFVAGKGALSVQACRLSGSSRTAALNVDFEPAATDLSGKGQLVRVRTPTQSAKDLLTTLELDLTEHGGPDFVDVVIAPTPAPLTRLTPPSIHMSEDAQKLANAGLEYEVLIDDLAASDRANARADLAFRRSIERSQLPSGNTGYRHLWDYETDMKMLARRNPNLVKAITLRYTTNEGREVHGLEITKQPNVSDGKPVFVQLGLHHAREWPSGEHALEFAFDLVNGYGKDARMTELMNSVRTIVVPVVNPDGFNLSREAPLGKLAYKRKNCRVVDGQGARGGICSLPASWSAGVDPNRNYGGFWGGPGASVSSEQETYRGPSPFSEPETLNVRDLVSKHQAVTLITNHTYGNLVLRAPGLRSQGPPPDELVSNDLAERMAAQNGYDNQPGYELYDTTGTTEDWTYWATGGLGYTFEIGPGPDELERFHPPFEEAVEEYIGHGTYAGKGNRGAYLVALENTADATRHAVLTGSAASGSILQIEKTFVTETSPLGIEGTKSRFEDRLQSRMVVPSSGQFAWHVNPSTRPIVVTQKLPTVSDSPSRAQSWDNTKSSSPQDRFDRTFEISQNDGAKLLAVRLDAPTPDDYDLDVYYRNGDRLERVAHSAAPPGKTEVAYVDDPPAGQYLLRVSNFAASGSRWTMKAQLFRSGGKKVTPDSKEYWTFSCRNSTSTTARQKIEITHGRRLVVDRPCAPNP